MIGGTAPPGAPHRFRLLARPDADRRTLGELAEAVARHLAGAQLVGSTVHPRWIDVRLAAGSSRSPEGALVGALRAPCIDAPAHQQPVASNGP